MLTPNVSLDGRTVFVTGAAGFIGANLAAQAGVRHGLTRPDTYADPVIG